MSVIWYNVDMEQSREYKTPHLIDNSRVELLNVLRHELPKHKHLSIATGYWDLAGTAEVIDLLEGYESIRLLIGQEPLPSHIAKIANINLEDPDNPFPDAAFKYDLEHSAYVKNNEELERLRGTAAKIAELSRKGVLSVKVFRKPRLHAKAYIFGNEQASDALGIVGSSNFTKAGMTANAELNTLEADSRIVVQSKPNNSNQEHGYLSWFNELWEDSSAVDWTGDFTQIIQESPVGDLCFGPYDVYIKTLMEVFSEEMVEVNPTLPQLKEFLYPFQDQNVHSLRQRLKTYHVAMLSDSVGLGKTITAGSIIKQYLEEGATRIIILPPASLVPQWEEELESERFDLIKNNDFRVVSQQNAEEIQKLIEYGKKRFTQKHKIDLVVIDEAHNLRNDGSKRHQQILELLQDNPEADVLLLTATPINNRLMDFAKQLELGAKGVEPDVKVIWKTGQSKTGKPKTQVIPYFDALNRIDVEAKKTEKAGGKFDWIQYRGVVAQGLQRFLVRSTRQGAMRVSPELHFPKSKVQQIEYQYSDDIILYLKNAIDTMIDGTFGGINPRCLNLDLASNITQLSAHPLDFLPSLKDRSVFQEKPMADYGVIPTIFQLVNLIGFIPYRPEIYQRKIYHKSIDELRIELNPDKKVEDHKIKAQLSAHNLLQVSWLKRLESSTFALAKSVDYYLKRLELFSNYLSRGYIFSLADALYVNDEYGDDLERAFTDYEQYLKDLANLLEKGGSEEDLKQKGIKRIPADETIYNIAQMKVDLERDRQICQLLKTILTELNAPKNNVKLQKFVEFLVQALDKQEYGQKVLIFSFFADTVKFLEESLVEAVGEQIPRFKERVEFTYGSGGKTEKLARRFAPVSKGYQLKEDEKEIDFLFATDVLSEGQNLQDAGILVNYDLHWNPVRMIQRNGRINRIGSKYQKVLIANAKPDQDLDIYLRLVRRLERKIDTIKNTIGTDQSVLGEKENPIEWTDGTGFYSNDSQTASQTLAEADSEEGDILSWTNDYLQDLKQFLAEHTNQHGEYDAKVRKIQNIPMGKWNYLPQSSNSSPDQNLGLADNQTLALYAVEGKFTDSQEKIEDTVFVKVSEGASRGPFSSLSAEVVDDEIALGLIKVTPENNQTRPSQIKRDRLKVISTANEEVRLISSSDKASYDIKPQKRALLEKINPSFGEIVLVDLFAKNLILSNDIQAFQKLTNKLSREYTELCSPKGTTISEFSNLVQKMQANDKGSRIIEKVDGVLYYVN